jgi:hypothetical protein
MLGSLKVLFFFPSRSSSPIRRLGYLHVLCKRHLFSYLSTVTTLSHLFSCSCTVQHMADLFTSFDLKEPPLEHGNGNASLHLVHLPCKRHFIFKRFFWIVRIWFELAARRIRWRSPMRSPTNTHALSPSTVVIPARTPAPRSPWWLSNASVRSPIWCKRESKVERVSRGDSNRSGTILVLLLMKWHNGNQHDGAFASTGLLKHPNDVQTLLPLKGF